MAWLGLLLASAQWLRSILISYILYRFLFLFFSSFFINNVQYVLALACHSSIPININDSVVILRFFLQFFFLVRVYVCMYVCVFVCVKMYFLHCALRAWIERNEKKYHQRRQKLMRTRKNADPTTQDEKQMHESRHSLIFMLEFAIRTLGALRLICCVRVYVFLSLSLYHLFFVACPYVCSCVCLCVCQLCVVSPTKYQLVRC